MRIWCRDSLLARKNELWPYLERHLKLLDLSPVASPRRSSSSHSGQPAPCPRTFAPHPPTHTPALRAQWSCVSRADERKKKRRDLFPSLALASSLHQTVGETTIALLRPRQPLPSRCRQRCRCQNSTYCSFVFLSSAVRRGCRRESPSQQPSMFETLATAFSQRSSLDAVVALLDGDNGLSNLLLLPQSTFLEDPWGLFNGSGSHDAVHEHEGPFHWAVAAGEMPSSDSGTMARDGRLSVSSCERAAAESACAGSAGKTAAPSAPSRNSFTSSMTGIAGLESAGGGEPSSRREAAGCAAAMADPLHVRHGGPYARAPCPTDASARTPQAASRGTQNRLLRMTESAIACFANGPALYPVHHVHGTPSAMDPWNRLPLSFSCSPQEPMTPSTTLSADDVQDRRLSSISAVSTAPSPAVLQSLEHRGGMRNTPAALAASAELPNVSTPSPASSRSTASGLASGNYASSGNTGKYLSVAALSPSRPIGTAGDLGFDMRAASCSSEGGPSEGLLLAVAAGVRSHPRSRSTVASPELTLAEPLFEWSTPTMPFLKSFSVLSKTGRTNFHRWKVASDNSRPYDSEMYRTSIYTIKVEMELADETCGYDAESGQQQQHQLGPVSVEFDCTLQMVEHHLPSSPLLDGIALQVPPGATAIAAGAQARDGTKASPLPKSSPSAHFRVRSKGGIPHRLTGKTCRFIPGRFSFIHNGKHMPYRMLLTIRDVRSGQLFTSVSPPFFVKSKKPKHVESRGAGGRTGKQCGASSAERRQSAQDGGEEAAEQQLRDDDDSCSEDDYVDADSDDEGEDETVDLSLCYPPLPPLPQPLGTLNAARAVRELDFSPAAETPQRGALPAEHGGRMELAVFASREPSYDPFLKRRRLQM